MSRRTDAVFYVQVIPEGSQEAERVDESVRVLSMTYQETEKKSDMLKLEVDNRDLSNFDDPIWKAGNKITVSWGYVGNMSEPRECTIQKVTGALKLSVEAQGDEAQMNKIVETRSFEDMTRSQVVRQLGLEQGFTDDTMVIEDTEEVHEVITQSRMTATQMIRRLAEIEGFEYFVDIDGLHFHKRKMGQKPTRSVQYYLPPDVGDVLSFNVTNDLFAPPGEKAGKVTSKGRDPIKKKDVEGTGSDAETSRETLAPVVSVYDPETETFKDQPRGAAPAPAAATSDTRPTTATSNTGAKREADGAYRKGQQRAVELTLELVGDPHLRGKSVIEVRGIGKRLSGLYYIKELTAKLLPFKLSAKCITDGAQKSQAQGGGGGTGGAGGTAGGGPGLACHKLQLYKAEAESLIGAVSSGKATAAQVQRMQQLEVLVPRYQQLCAAERAGKSKAEVNKQLAEDNAREAANAAAKLEERSTYDPETETLVTTYHRSGGKGQGKK